MGTENSVSPEQQREIYAHRVELLYRGVPAAVAASFVTVALMNFLHYDVVDFATLVVWSGVIFFVTGLRYVSYLAFTRIKPAPNNIGPWLTLMQAIMIALGVAWGTVAWIMMPIGDMAHQVFTVAAMLGIVAGAMSGLYPMMSVFAAFILPATIQPVIRLLWLGERPHLMLAVMSLLLVVYMMVFGRRHAQVLMNSLTLGYENKHLVRKLTDEVAVTHLLNQELNDAKEQAETATVAKTKVLAAASHDLRQPLQALNLFLYSLAGREHDANSRYIIEQIGNSAQALEELLNALLDVSRLDAGAIDPVKTPFDLSAMLRRVGGEFELIAEDQGLAFTVETADVNAISDPILLENILRNLLANAFRHTASGTVTLRCLDLGEALRIEVEDTGIGIAAENLERIFDEFYQVNNPERARRMGLGLGLSIVHKTCQLLGHGIDVASVEGQGSIFTLELPKAPLQRPAPAPALAPAALTGHPQLPEATYAVVIEDDADVRHGLKVLLEMWGCQVRDLPCIGRDDVARCGACGGCGEVFAPDSPVPDLILADYDLSEGLTGIHAMDLVRAHFNSAIPALLLTGNITAEVLHQAKSHNTPILHKPVDGANLHTEISRVLGLVAAE